MTTTINIIHGDGVKALEAMEENQYDLAIVDPPYGIGESSKDIGRNGFGAYRKRSAYKIKDWDNEAPDPSYFDILNRKSKNQIIFGANHFIDNIPFNVSSSCWIVWDKVTGTSDFADAELAWTSFKTAVRVFKFQWAGMLQGNMKNKQKRIHPTEKPIALYKWILKNYAKQDYKIIDNYGGSMSHAIAAIDMGFSLDIYEIDDDYYHSAVERIKRHVSQLDLSRPPCKINYITN